MKTVLEIIEEISLNPEELKEMVNNGEFKTFSIISLDQNLSGYLESTFEEIVSLIEDYPLAVIEAGTKLGIPVSEIRESFLGGEYTSDEEFTNDYDYFGFLDDIPSEFASYIDYAKVTKTLMQNYISQDGFYFLA